MQRITGVKEAQIVQWFVEPGAEVKEFDRICEVASDKAITEVISLASLRA